MRIARSSGRRVASRCLPQLRMRPVVLGAEAPQLVEADHHRIAEAMQPVHVEHDDPAEVRQPRAHLERLVELLVVLDEEVDRARVGHQVFDLRGGVGRIDAGGHAARAEHAEVGVEPFAPRVREHRGGLARLEAEAHEAEPDFPRDLAELAPGGAAPDPELLLPQGDLVAAARDRVPEHEGEGVAGNDRLHRLGGHGFHRQVFLRFQRRSPRTPAACMPR